MYLSREICLRAFGNLHLIDPESSDGKRAKERVSGLRYFLAALSILKGNLSSSIDLSPSQTKTRKEFTDAVGGVVMLNSEGDYSTNFSGEVSRTSTYGVSNNFLTSSLKRDGTYPNRPAPLLIKNSEKLSVHPDWKANLLSFGDFESYKLDLSIWLARFYSGINPDDVAGSIAAHIKDVYGENLFELLLGEGISKLEEIVSEYGLSSTAPDLDVLIENSASTEEHTADRLVKIGVNKIFYGAPGTGKSYRVFTDECKGAEKVVTVFHPDTQYSDFVGALKPKMERDNSGQLIVTYRFRAGPFTRALLLAKSQPEKYVCLVIEEINRASAAAVFGELFQLLDRNENGESTYRIDAADPDMLEYINEQLELSGREPLTQLQIPENLSLFATMNSSDQAVMPLDTAFKRRWMFEYLEINFAHPEVSRVSIPIKTQEGTIQIQWPDFAQTINNVLIDLGVAEDRLIGQFFLNKNELKDASVAMSAINDKLFVYLWDDVLRHFGDKRIFSKAFSTFGQLSSAFRRGEAIFSNMLEERFIEKCIHIDEVTEALSNEKE
ncbi:AAA family ATPase [Vibrio parahaemolyticus]|uniref:AAA family ATPase n=1 Tax=Vibrio parahaemolyticus TaxID=670 RepID=UPI00042521C6|nr:AAA family ATPase [Vibrio parahaemolyticus]MBE4012686.1 AAA domain-containing protein [Vibrio parahaemolyticus]MDF4750332.1 AAA family ATPase [Vibrio parahaemolyticus]